MVPTKEKISILLAAGIYPPDPGGPALHAKKFHEWLDEQVVENKIVALSKYRFLPIGLRHLVYVWKLWRQFSGVDVVYAYDALGVGLPALIVSKFKRKKLLIRIGGDIPWERAAGKNLTDLSMNEWYRAGEHKKSTSFKISRFILRRTAKIITSSDLLSKLYINYYDVNPDKIVTIPNPVPEKTGDSRVASPRTIIFASRLVAYKNLSAMLDVLSRVLPDFQDVKFVIMGDGPEKKKLQAKSRALNIDKQIVFLGNILQEEVMRKTAECYIGLAPALTEFNPNYILQCLSFGKPFLISKENGLPFNLPEEFLISPRDHSQVEERIRYILSDQGYRQSQEVVRGLDFRLSWDEILKRNLETIIMLK